MAEDDDEMAKDEMAGMDEDEEDMNKDEMAGMDEDEMDVDLKEIIKSLKEDDDDDNDDDSKDEMAENEVKLQEAYNTIKSLRKTINEVNLLNAKLLFSNKLFRSNELSESQKVKVIETLDRAVNMREVKLVYSTLAESFTRATKSTRKRKSISEGIASKRVAGTKPVKKVISEGATLTNRFKKLANIL
jgi:hypothetical protein